MQEGTPSEPGEELMTSYMVALNKPLRKINKHVTGTHSRALDGPVHDIQAGDCVCVKPFTEKALEPQWTGPFQVLLTTSTVVKVKGQNSWIHHTGIKKAPAALWKITPGNKGLKLKFTPAK